MCAQLDKSKKKQKHEYIIKLAFKTKGKALFRMGKARGFEEIV